MPAYEPLPLAATASIAKQPVSLATPPDGYVVRPHLGLLTHEALDGQVVHRTSKPMLLETRAIKTPRGLASWADSVFGRDRPD